MTGEQARRLEERFAESGTEWRRLADRDDLERFLALAGLAPPFAAVRAGKTAFTLADAIILETGSVVLSGLRLGSRRAVYLAETHLALVDEDSVFETLGDFLAVPTPGWHERSGPAMTIITGPSRTADIEKTLVMGAHGPRRLIVATAPAALIAEFFDEADR